MSGTCQGPRSCSSLQVNVLTIPGMRVSCPAGLLLQRRLLPRVQLRQGAGRQGHQEREALEPVQLGN